MWTRPVRSPIGCQCGPDQTLTNWRNPHIVVSIGRFELWLGCVREHEARVVLEDKQDLTVERVLVSMPSLGGDGKRYRDAYRAHQFACADVDPWDVRHIYYPSGEGQHRSKCLLPRPADLLNFTLDELAGELEKLRIRRWPNQGKYWYVPPEGWDSTCIEKMRWRRGAFPEEATQNRKRQHKRGPIDYQKRIWLWDENEGHWDVQLEADKYLRINHEGSLLV